MRGWITFTILCIYGTLVHGQILNFDHGKVSFHTSSIMSDIEAESENFEVALNASTREVKVVIPISSFDFEYGMMQDHFNEEYLESELYPNATLIGKVSQDISDLSTPKTVSVVGDLTIHGVTKKTDFEVGLSQNDGFTRVKFAFPIVFKDFNVEEPSIFSKSVAKDVELKGVFYLK